MKRVFFTLLLVVICCVAKSQEPLTVVEFDEYVHDFGKINEVDGEVSYTFKYKNIGNKPLVIYGISSSCGCTVPTYSKKPLGVGKSSEIKITFDPTNQPGRIDKKIIVSGNVPEGAIELRIKAIVTPRPRTIEDDFPVLFSDGIRLADIVIEGYNAANTKESSFTLDVINNSTKSAVIKVVNDSLPKWITALVVNPFLGAKERTKILVNVRPDSSLWGRKSVAIPVLVNDKEQFVDLNFNVIFVEDFSALSKTELRFIPRATLSSSFYHFSTAEQGEKLEYKFKIKNSGVNPLIIRYIDNPKNVKIAIDKKELLESQEAIITLTLDSTESGSIAEIVRFITNDPIKPVVELRVMANVK